MNKETTTSPAEPAPQGGASCPLDKAPGAQAKKPGAHTVWGQLLPLLGRYRRAALLSPLFTVVTVLLEISIPRLTATLIDEGIARGEIAVVLRVGLLMALAALLSMAFGIRAGRETARAAAGFAANLRETMYARVQDYSFANIDRFSTSGLITRMTTDVVSLQDALQMILTMFVRAPITLVGALFMAFSISARLSLVFLGALIVLVVSMGIILPMAMRYFTQMFARYDALNAVVQENVRAIRVVKSTVREAHEGERFEGAARALYRNAVSAERVIAATSPVMMMTVYSTILLLSWFGAKMIVGQAGLTTGQLTSLLSYVMNILMSLMMLSMVLVMVTRSQAAGERVLEVLSESPDIASPEDAVQTVADGSIVFQDVAFSYLRCADRPVLFDVDLSIASGETIGIIGGTGSSKSSLVNLIPRLYDVCAGSVRLGGIDVRRYDLHALRGAVAVVLQKNVLFSGTVRENLLWGRPEASDADLIAALRAAAADFVLEAPEGLDARVERGGANFSGGQRQRLCIARALVSRPKVLILDDATSAVDTATDARIRKGLREALPGTTKLIIAQRIASVEDADRVIVMDEGRVAAFDTPERLLETCAIYREVYESQTRDADFDEAERRQAP